MPSIGNSFHFVHAVELVARKIEKKNHFRISLSDDAWKVEFIDF